ncbi:Uncharacterised protein [Serratia quinivorans]|uniref:hypothetical protein n=1 Tax=Serratia quinivorans TaxID=137545 RepID=UPI0021784641|nr:hypothetical protein [Serratia quinivorans]CAI1771118.1 Uncharacterised protein [Serratia quinivorans]
MKKVLRNLAGFFFARKKIKLQESYIKYLEGEVARNNEIKTKDAYLMNDRCQEINELQRDNSRLTEHVARLRELCEQQRQLVLGRGATDAEIKFMEACKDMYLKGKMISKLRFEASMYEVLKQRSDACINRKFKVNNAEETMCNKGVN